MTSRSKLILAMVATLAVATWLNAGEEHATACPTCAPMAATLEAMADGMRVQSAVESR